VSGGEERASVDDWEAHWRAYADAVGDNPAQEFGRRLIACDAPAELACAGCSTSETVKATCLHRCAQRGCSGARRVTSRRVALLLSPFPGGPRTAFDRHSGHRRHYRPNALRAVVEQAGLDVVDVHGAGFPFFNAYKLVVLLRGKALMRDASVNAPPSWLAKLVMSAFGAVLRPGLNSRVGSQLVALARRSGGPEGAHA
jgi:hypothetical protein